MRDTKPHLKFEYGQWLYVGHGPRGWCAARGKTIADAYTLWCCGTY